jgi:hypothetical protein
MTPDAAFTPPNVWRRELNERTDDATCRGSAQALERTRSPVGVTYTWESLGASRSRMTLRNRAEPSGCGKLAATIMVAAMGRANKKDLMHLKTMLEGRSRDG